MYEVIGVFEEDYRGQMNFPGSYYSEPEFYDKLSDAKTAVKELFQEKNCLGAFALNGEKLAFSIGTY